MITATELRAIEAAANPQAPKALRQALKDAADTLEARTNGADRTQLEQLALDAASILEEIGNARVSQTMTEHRAAELMQQDRQRMLELASRFRELLNA